MWLQGEDLNSRPPDNESDELPDCSTLPLFARLKGLQPFRDSPSKSILHLRLSDDILRNCYGRLDNTVPPPANWKSLQFGYSILQSDKYRRLVPHVNFCSEVKKQTRHSAPRSPYDTSFILEVVLDWFPLRESNSYSWLQRPVSYH